MKRVIVALCVIATAIVAALPTHAAGRVSTMYLLAFDYTGSGEPELAGEPVGDELFLRFLEEMEPFVDEESNSALYSTTRGYIDSNGEHYVEYTGGTMEEWYDMSTFERYVWYYTYVFVVHNYVKFEYDFNFGSKDNYFNTVASFGVHGLSLWGSDQALDAYKDLMTWQYEYVVANADVYNFFTKQSYFDYKHGRTPSVSEGMPNGSADDSAYANQEDTPEELVSTSIFKEMWYIFVILFILVATLIVVIIVKKRRNVGEPPQK